MSSADLARSVVLLLFVTASAAGQTYPDQHFVQRIDSLRQNIESISGMSVSPDSSCLMLQSDRTQGYVIMKAQSSPHPFNQGLPSWNGSAPDASSSFMVQMRFPYNGGWSPWLTVGYWKDYFWTTYGPTSYGGGYVEIDYVKLNGYQSSWQFKVTMMRTDRAQASPTLRKLSFFVSDSRATESLNLTELVNDRPPGFFVPTEFIYQYGVDPEIGGSICSPTSVSMILRSYDIPVDALEFARTTYDPYHEMFGVWPRVVENASEFGLDGAVTRYRTWSQARDVLAAGGRISMSVGPPLYAGHLMMLAGFTASGDPIVHDPARADGYAHVFNKTDLSRSWFEKGGVAYTFFPEGSGPLAVDDPVAAGSLPEGFRLDQNYPNPFNPLTTIGFHLHDRGRVALRVYDVVGNEVCTLLDEDMPEGEHAVRFSATGLASGVYFYRLQLGTAADTKRMHLVR